MWPSTGTRSCRGTGTCTDCLDFRPCTALHGSTVLVAKHVAHSELAAQPWVSGCGIHTLTFQLEDTGPTALRKLIRSKKWAPMAFTRNKKKVCQSAASVMQQLCCEGRRKLQEEWVRYSCARSYDPHTFTSTCSCPRRCDLLAQPYQQLREMERSSGTALCSGVCRGGSRGGAEPKLPLAETPSHVSAPIIKPMFTPEAEV